MSSQKIAKKLPKRVTNDKLKTRRALSWAASQTRKEQRVARNAAQAKANKDGAVTPGPVPSSQRNRIRPRSNNMRTCLRCERRKIVAGSVCVCRTIGEGH